MKNCPKCNFELADSDAICPNCGTTFRLITYKELPMPNIFHAYISMWKNCFKFSGRSRRSDYWYSRLMNLIISLILIFLIIPINKELYDVANSIYTLIIFIPELSLTVRRLHDVGNSGYILLGLYATELLLMLLIHTPLAYFIVGTINILFTLIFLVTDSEKEENDYGKSPKYVPVYGNLADEQTTNNSSANNENITRYMVYSNDLNKE